MGWGFRDIGRAINRGANNLVNNVVDTIRNPGRIADDPLGLLTDYTIGVRGGIPAQIGIDEVKKMMTPEEPPEPKQDQRLIDIRREMSEDATKFRSGLDDYKRGKKSGLIGAYADATEQGVRRTRENYSRRGLLYSGLANRGETEVRGNIQGQFDRSMADINREAEQIADTKEQAAAAAGIEQATQLLNQAEQYYNISSQNDLARRRAFGNLASGIGYGAGSLIGSGGGQGLINSQPQPRDYAMYNNPDIYGNAGSIA